MSKAYEMIAESLEEIIKDLEDNDGKNLKREILSQKRENKKLSNGKIYKRNFKEKIFEQTTTV